MARAAAEASRSTHATVVYVYGFVRAGALASIREDGVGGAPVRVVERDDVAAIVSPVESPEPRLRRRDLHSHLRVIEAAFGTTTILPCPFGTIVESESELEEGVLVGARDDLLTGLDRLDGTVQMNVKASYDEEELLRDIVVADPRVAALRERTRTAGDEAQYERLRLGELVAGRIEERTELDAERLLSALGRNAIDVAVERPDTATALKAAFLVERAALPRFESTLEAVARDAQPLLRFDVIGPLPPTAFAATYTTA